MPSVQILRRDRTVRVVAGADPETTIAVSYMTEAFAPQVVFLPPAAYREATPEELAQNDRYKYVPISKDTQKAELDEIRADIDRRGSQKPDTFELR
jgi:hypothetical protein